MIKQIPIIFLIITPLFVVNPIGSTNNNELGRSSFSDYEFLWESLENAPGNIQGDDSIFWGSDLGPYYNYSELTNKLIILNNTFPEIIDLYSIGKSCLGKDLWMIRLTDESVHENKHGFFMVSHHHGREVITIMNGLYVIDRFISDYITRNTSLSSFGTSIPFTYYTGDNQVPDIQSLLAHTELFFLLSLNPDALDIIYINPWQRKNLCEYDDDFDGNASNNIEQIKDSNNDGFISNSDGFLEGGVFDFPGGVDLNRNYDYRFLGPGSSSNRKEETYRGPNPFSEPETQAIRDWTLNHQYELNYALSLHSGSKSIINPWGYTEGIDSELEILNTISDKGLVSITGFPNWDTIGGYLVNGEWGDWTYGFTNIPAFTIETYGNSSAWKGDTGIWDFFNPNANEIVVRSEIIYKAAYFLASSPSNEGSYLHRIENFEVKRLSSDKISISWKITSPNSESVTNITYSVKIYLSNNNENWNLISETNGVQIILPMAEVRDFKWIKIIIEDNTNKRVYSVFNLEDAITSPINVNSSSDPVSKAFGLNLSIIYISLGVIGMILIKKIRKKI